MKQTSIFLEDNLNNWPPVEMKALTWKQPFAELMFFDKIETRVWSTNYRGWVLICAGLSVYNDINLRVICGDQLKRLENTIHWPAKYLVKGSAVGVGYLSDCRPMKPEDSEKCFVEYSPRLYCHVYTNVKRINPIKFKGAQGWKNLSQEFINQIEII